MGKEYLQYPPVQLLLEESTWCLAPASGRVEFVKRKDERREEAEQRSKGWKWRVVGEGMGMWCRDWAYMRWLRAGSDGPQR
jgi:hypothetical protein